MLAKAPHGISPKNAVGLTKSLITVSKMATKIVSKKTGIEGVELIYLEDKGVAGIHVRGLAKLLDCNPKVVFKQLEGVAFEHVFRAEIKTEQGLRTVTFILEDGVIQILEALQDGRHQPSTKLAARDLYRKFAKAGFKLYTMLKLAPKKVAPAPKIGEDEEFDEDTGVLFGAASGQQLTVQAVLSQRALSEVRLANSLVSSARALTEQSDEDASILFDLIDKKLQAAEKYLSRKASIQ